MVETIRLLIGEDEVTDEVINVYIDRAVMTIFSYLNNKRYTPEYIKQEFSSAVILLVENTYLLRDKKFIKSKSLGKRSYTFSDNVFESIPAEVKNILPPPFVRLS